MRASFLLLFIAFACTVQAANVYTIGHYIAVTLYNDSSCQNEANFGPYWFRKDSCSQRIHGNGQRWSYDSSIDDRGVLNSWSMSYCNYTLPQCGGEAVCVTNGLECSYLGGDQLPYNVWVRPVLIPFVGSSTSLHASINIIITLVIMSVLFMEQ